MWRRGTALPRRATSGAIALRTGRKLTWDGAAEEFVGDFARETNPYVQRELRASYDYSFIA